MVEYRIRPVTRYIVTRFESSGDGQSGSVGSSVIGEFPNQQTAQDCANAFNAWNEGIPVKWDPPEQQPAQPPQFAGVAQA